ncbi:MAG: hypothetical protein IPL26_19590 [Leptospiraceae bacterium]|nr:hypothetical protein [Leptospiraceae bacterium]
MIGELINEKIEHDLSSLWIGCLGEIVSYSKSESFAEVHPLIKVKNKEDFYRLPIVKCPIGMSVGNSLVLIPDFKKGDIVELKGNIYPVDNQLKGQVEISSGLRFLLSNCTIVSGHVKKPNSINPSVLKDGFVVANATGQMYAQFSDDLIEFKIGISPSTEKSVLGETLKSKMDTLCDKVNAILDAIALLTVTCTAPASPSSPPINAASFTTIKSEITTLKSELGDILSEGFKHN